MKVFWNDNDVAGYLVGTIILYKNLPHQISGQSKHSLSIYRVDSNDVFEVSKTDPYLDVGTIPLGYINYKDNVYFLQRTPRRQWRQGVREGNLELFHNDSKSPTTRNLKGILHSSAFVNSVRGKFPSFSTAKNLSIPYVAISRDVMIKAVDGKSYEIFHQKELVGSISPKGKITLIEGPCKWAFEDELSKINWKD